MPNINAFFPASGDWLKLPDLQGRAIKVRIEEVRPIQVPDFNDKNILHPALELGLGGTDKTFVCKKMNAESISSAYGPDTDNWINKEIVLKPGKLGNFDGIVAEPVREVVEGFDQQVAQATAGTRMPDYDHPNAPPPGEYEHGAKDSFDDDIPF